MEIRTSNSFAPRLNRVTEALQDFHTQESRYRLGNPLAAADDRDAVTMQIHYYRSIYETLRKGASAAERKSLQFVRSEIPRLQARLTPTGWNRLWQHPLVRAARHWIAGNRRNMVAHRKELNQQYKALAAQFNTAALSKAIKTQGFKGSLDGPLQRMIALNQPEFYVRHFEISQPDTDYVLHFRKIPGTDNYHFDNFQAISRPSSNDLATAQANSVRQQFCVGDELNCSALQAASLVNGRAVSKDGMEWWSLDQTKLNDPFPITLKVFDILKSIEELPFKIHDKYLSRIKEDLMQGIIAESPIIGQDSQKKYKLQADPNNETIHVMDAKGHPVNKYSLSPEAQRQQQEKAQKIIQRSEENQNIDIDLQPVQRRFQPSHNR